MASCPLKGCQHNIIRCALHGRWTTRCLCGTGILLKPHTQSALPSSKQGTITLHEYHFNPCGNQTILLPNSSSHRSPAQK